MPARAHARYNCVQVIYMHNVGIFVQHCSMCSLEGPYLKHQTLANTFMLSAMLHLCNASATVVGSRKQEIVIIL